MTTLDDSDSMPWGKYRGKQMAEVPGNYLHWLWTTGKKEDKTCPVADYIRRNLHVLQKELPDAIWE